MTFTAPITAFGQAAYADLEPVWADDDQRGYPLQTFVAGLGEAFRQVEQTVRAQAGRDPYQQVYDINRTPDFLLPFVAQFVGQTITPDATPAVQRTQIKAETGFYRGTIPNLVAAAAANQTEPDHTTVLERVPDAWGIAVAYDPAFTPDVAAYERAVTAATAWGLALTFSSSSMPLFEEASATKTFESVGATVTFESATLTNVS